MRRSQIGRLCALVLLVAGLAAIGAAPAGAAATYGGRFGGRLSTPGDPGKFQGSVWGLAVANGFVYATDNVDGRIQKLTTSGAYVKDATRVGEEKDIDADDAGNVYLLGNSRIRVLDSELQRVRDWTLPVAGSGLTVDAANGSVYVADETSHQVLRYDLSGALESTITLTDFRYYDPMDVAVNGAGDLFVSSGTGIAHLRPNGALVAFWFVNSASFHTLAIDPNGNLHAVDYFQFAGPNSVYVFSGLGALLETYGPKNPSSGAHPEGTLFGPRGIDIDTDGSIYIGDSTYVNRWTRGTPPPPPGGACSRSGHQTGNVAVCADKITGSGSSLKATGDVRLENGVSVGDGPITLDDAAKRITGSSVTMSIGSHEYGTGALAVDARDVTDSISGRTELAKFTLTNVLTFTLGSVPLGTVSAGQYIDGADGGGVVVSVQPGFDLLGALKDVTTKGAFAYGFHASSGARILGGSVELGNIKLPGGWELGTLKVAYESGANRWSFAGGGSVPFLKGKSIEVSASLRGRRIDSLGVKVEITGGGVPLGQTGIMLDSFAGEISGLAKGPIIIKAAVGGGWTKTPLPKPFNWIIHIKDVTLTIDTSGGAGVSGGVAIVDGEGRLAKGTLEIKGALSPFQVSGKLDTELNMIPVSVKSKTQAVLTSEHLTATGSITGEIAGIDVGGGSGVFSETGAGVTAHVLGYDVGAGVYWRDVTSFPPSVRWIGADVDQFVTVTASKRRGARAAATPFTFAVAKGNPLLVAEARGAAAATDFTLVSPSGVRYTAAEKRSDSYVASYGGGSVRVVAVHRPAPGTWTLEPASAAAATRFTVNEVPAIGRIRPRTISPSGSKRRPLSRRRSVVLRWVTTARMPKRTRVALYVSSSKGRPGKLVARGLPVRGRKTVSLRKLRRGANYFTAVVSEGRTSFGSARFPNAVYRAR